MRFVAGSLLMLSACVFTKPPRPYVEVTGAVGWEFKGRAALPDALAMASRVDRPVLIGLSGGDD